MSVAGERPPAFFKGSDGDAVFHQTLRSTITNLDSLRLNAVTSGLTVCSALFGSALVLLSQAPGTFSQLGSAKWGALIAVPVWLVAAGVAWAYQRKVKLFGECLGAAVGICAAVESALIVRPDAKLTHRFERFVYSGFEGLEFFQGTMRLFVYAGVIGAVVSLALFLESAGLFTRLGAS